MLKDKAIVEIIHSESLKIGSGRVSVVEKKNSGFLLFRNVQENSSVLELVNWWF